MQMGGPWGDPMPGAGGSVGQRWGRGMAVKGLEGS